MDQLQSAINKLGKPYTLKSFPLHNGPTCYLTSIEPKSCFEFWQKARSILKPIGWYPVLINGEDDLSRANGFTQSEAARQQVTAPSTTAPGAPSAFDEAGLRLKKQYDQLENMSVGDYRKLLAEQTEKHTGADFFGTKPSMSRDILQMSDSALEAMLKQSRDSMKETMQFVAKFPASVVQNHLQKLHAFENPHGEPKSAIECIKLGNSLDAQAWFKLRRSIDDRYDSVEVGIWGANKFIMDIDHKVYSDENPVALFVQEKHGFNVPAALGFGGWNDCPSPQIQTAILKRWHGLYGAELVSLGLDTLALYIPESVKTKEVAVSIAKEQYVYCNDLVDQSTGLLNDLAAQILDAHIWDFWWD